MKFCMNRLLFVRFLLLFFYCSRAKSNIRRKGFVSVYNSISQTIITVQKRKNSSKAGTWRQELEQKPRRSTSWFVPPGLPSLTFYIPTMTICPGEAPPTMYSALPRQSLRNKIIHKSAYRDFLNCFLFSGNSRLCQFDRNNNKIQNTVLSLLTKSQCNNMRDE